MNNPNCDGTHCVHASGEVRLLPYGGGGNIILCKNCYLHEMRYRAQRNVELRATVYAIPAWKDLAVYQGT